MVPDTAPQMAYGPQQPLKTRKVHNSETALQKGGAEWDCAHCPCNSVQCSVKKGHVTPGNQRGSVGREKAQNCNTCLQKGGMKVVLASNVMTQQGMP